MGKVIMSGVVPQMVAPMGGIPASELAVGSSVYLMENESAVEYLVVNQGIPAGSSLYDNSCDGTWLLRKDVHSTSQYYTSQYCSDYSKSLLHTYLNGEFLSLFNAATNNAIKTVKIPYSYAGGYSLHSGANGLSVKAFALSHNETNVSGLGSIVDGAVLSYFEEASASKRIAYYNNTATAYWLRSQEKETEYGTVISTTGSAYSQNSNSQAGVRPVIVLPFNSLFDENTLLFKGVS